MADAFGTHAKGLGSPADTHAAVVPSDGSDLPQRPRALFVGTGGDIVMQDGAGTVVTWASVPGGAVLPFRPLRILATGTTAADIVAMW